MWRRAIFVFLVIAAAAGCTRSDATSGDPKKRRIVCLTPSSTEIVAALGALDEIVGVDEYSRYPPGVHGLPKVGDFLHPNLEAILALHPDIVVLDSVQTQVQLVLQNTGITVVSPPMQTIDDIRSALVTIGAAIGRTDEASALVATFDAEIRLVTDGATSAAARAGGRPRVLFVVDRELGGLGKIWAAGPDTYMDQIIRLAGGVNVLADAPVRSVNLSAEEVIARAPDVILDAVHTTDVTRARADWDVLASVPAVRTGRIHILADPAVVSPGPRLPGVLRVVAKHLWP